jgi:protoporphyrinogen oxidase
MGLALAQRLAAAGHAVTVLEREAQLGGLATYHDYGGFFWDRFYHCILPSDSHLLRFVSDIGLGDRLRWRRTLTGFYVDDRLHSMSDTREFLRFPPVTPWGKVRLALTILYCSRIRDWRRLEAIPVGEWLRRMGGRRTYEKIWKPLLLAKLGENHHRVSAVFIWSYIKRLFAARHSSAKQEHLGYVAGGYKAVLERIGELVRAAGGDIRTAVSVARIEPARGGGLWVECDGRREHFEKVVFTSPVNVLEKVAAGELLRVARPGGRVEYLGVVCMVLVTRRPLVPHYVVNIADERVPFTGIIGMSNLVSGDETGGLHLTYLPKYVLSDDPLLRCPDEEVRTLFFEGLATILPEYKRTEIESVHINRALKVQPLQVLNYSTLVPQVATAHPDFFVLNTAQFVNCTLNNNEVIRAVDEFLTAFRGVFHPPR